MLLKFSRWMSTSLSILTMTLLPLSDGFAAQNRQIEINKQMVKDAIYQMGLNKSTTYGEFYEKNKNLFPPRLQKEFSSYFLNNKNEKMPQFEISSVKDSEGRLVPMLRSSQNGELFSVQFTGEENKFLKFNNTNLSEIDLINFTDAIKRITSSEQKLRNQVRSSSNLKSVGTKKFPDFDSKVWAKLSPTQRAGYAIAMRSLYNDAHGVLLALDSTKKKKSKKFSLLSPFFGHEASAKPEGNFETIYDEDKLNSNSSSTKSTQSNSNDSDSCLVAGYVTTYKGKTCTYSSMKEEYKNESTLAGKAFKFCGNKIACNPLVFGTPGGEPRCIKRTNPKLQQATHWKGPCEDRNQTTNTEIQFLKDKKDNAGRYASENITMTKDDIEAEAFKQQKENNLEATKSYIEGILKYNNKDLLDVFTSKKPNEDLIKELIRIKDDFNTEISQATEACKQASSSGKYHEKNFWGACDQLQRRFIFVEAYLNEQIPCHDKKQVNSQTLMCGCGAEKEVAPGAVCTAPPKVEPPLVPPVVPPTTTDPTVDPVSPSPNQDIGSCEKTCDLKTHRCEKVEYDGVIAYDCILKGLVVKPEKKNGFGLFLKKALPFIATAAVLTGMYFLWKPKKVGLDPAGDRCPDGSMAPCKPLCESPKVYLEGQCRFPGCPPGSTIIDTTGACGKPERNVKHVCADGLTIVDSPDQCPARINCPDGTVIYGGSCPSDLENFPKVNSKSIK